MLFWGTENNQLELALLGRFRRFRGLTPRFDNGLAQSRAVSWLLIHWLHLSPRGFGPISPRDLRHSSQQLPSSLVRLGRFTLV